MNNINNLQQNTKEWLSWRMGKIGASDLPIILGVSPYCSRLTLWKIMCGFAEPKEENVAMKKGKEKEPIIREAINRDMKKNFMPRCLTHPELPWAIASLDGLDEENNQILEIKCNSKEKHAMVIKGDIPIEHYPQLQWQLFVSGYEEVVYVSHNADENVIVKIKRNEDYILKTLLPAATDFLRRIINFDPPEGEETEHEYVHIRDPQFDVLSENWKLVNFELKQLEKKEKELKEKLISFTDDGNCQGNGIKISRIKREGAIDWKKLYETIVKDYAAILLDEKYDSERYRKQEIGFWKIEEI